MIYVQTYVECIYTSSETNIWKKIKARQWNVQNVLVVKVNSIMKNLIETRNG